MIDTESSCCRCGSVSVGEVAHIDLFDKKRQSDVSLRTPHRAEITLKLRRSYKRFTRDLKLQAGCARKNRDKNCIKNCWCKRAFRVYFGLVYFDYIFEKADIRARILLLSDIIIQ